MVFGAFSCFGQQFGIPPNLRKHGCMRAAGRGNCCHRRGGQRGRPSELRSQRRTGTNDGSAEYLFGRCLASLPEFLVNGRWAGGSLWLVCLVNPPTPLLRSIAGSPGSRPPASVCRSGGCYCAQRSDTPTALSLGSNCWWLHRPPTLRDRRLALRWKPPPAFDVTNVRILPQLVPRIIHRRHVRTVRVMGYVLLAGAPELKSLRANACSRMQHVRPSRLLRRVV